MRSEHRFGWARSSIVWPHLYHSTAPPFRVCVILFLSSLNPLGLVRDLPSIGPFHGLHTDHVEKCDHSVPRLGSDGLVSLPFRPTTTIRSPPPTKRKPRTFHAGHRLGWARPPSLVPHAPPFFHGRHLRRLPPPRAIQGHHRRFTSQPRQWRRGHWRSSWIGFQAALRSLHRPPLAPPF